MQGAVGIVRGGIASYNRGRRGMGDKGVIFGSLAFGYLCGVEGGLS